MNDFIIKRINTLSLIILSTLVVYGVHIYIRNNPIEPVTKEFEAVVGNDNYRQVLLDHTTEVVEKLVPHAEKVSQDENIMIVNAPFTDIPSLQPVKAPIQGTVVSINQVGDIVRSGDPLAYIYNSNSVNTSFFWVNESAELALRAGDELVVESKNQKMTGVINIIIGERSDNQTQKIGVYFAQNVDFNTFLPNQKVRMLVTH